jgi:hypothetical protein
MTNKFRTPTQTLEDGLVVARNFARLVGVPTNTEIRFATRSQLGIACAGFHDAPHFFEKPFILIDIGEIFEKIKENSNVIIEAIIGLVLHEAMHILHSRKIYVRMQKQKDHALLRSLENLLEDYRIENLLLEDSPSLSRYIFKIRERLVVRQWLDRSVRNWPILRHRERLYTMIGAYIRAPVIFEENPFLLEFVNRDGQSIFEELCRILPEPSREEQDVADQAQRLMNFLTQQWKMTDGMQPPEECIQDLRAARQGAAGLSDEGWLEEINNSIYLDPEEQCDEELEDGSWNDDLENTCNTWTEGNQVVTFPEIGEEISAESDLWIHNANHSYPIDTSSIDTASVDTSSVDTSSIDTSSWIRQPNEGWKTIFEIADICLEANRAAQELSDLPIFEEACLVDGTVQCGIAESEAQLLEKFYKLLQQRIEDEHRGSRDLPEQYLPDELRGKIDMKHAPVDSKGSRKYQEAKQLVQPLIFHLRDVFPLPREGKNRYSRNHSRGQIDSGRLYRAGFGNQIFRARSVSKRREKIIVGILLDGSGSMSYGRRSAYTLQMAVLFNETFLDHPNVDLSFFSHSTDEMDSTCILFRHGRADDADTKSRIGNYQTYHRNFDYQAIWGTVACLSAQAKLASQRYLLVVSDGLPCTPGRSRASGVVATRKAVTEVRQLGWRVVGIGIDDCHCEGIYGAEWTVSVPTKNLTLETCRLLKILLHRC